MKAFVFNPSNGFIGKLTIQRHDQVPEEFQKFSETNAQIPLGSYIEASGKAWTVVNTNPFQLQEGRVQVPSANPSKLATTPAMHAKGPVEIKCPNCGSSWELSKEEAHQPLFTCDDCKTAFDPQQAVQPRSHSVLSRISTTTGIASIVLMVIPIIGRLINGTNRLGLTPYGERLFRGGFSYPVASALDFGNASSLMMLAMLIGLIAVLSGLIALFGTGRKNLAVTGMVTGGLCSAGPFLLVLL